MAKAGFVKDFRKELESDVWLMPPLYGRVWQWLKYSVNHEDRRIPQVDGSVFVIKAGQRLTSYRQIAEGVAWYEGRTHKVPNPKTIAAIVLWLQTKNMIAVEHGRGNREHTLITPVNWALYQGKEVDGVTVNGSAKKQQTDQVPDQPTDINKNGKNEEEINTTAKAVVGKPKSKANKQTISPEARQIVRYLSDSLKQRGGREGQFDQGWAFAGFNAAEKLLKSFAVQELEAAIDFLLDHKYHGTGITSMSAVANKILVWQREAGVPATGQLDVFEDPLSRGCK